MTDEQLHTSHLSSFIMFFSLFFIYFFSPFVFCYFSFMYHFALAFILRAIEAATRSTHARHSRPGVTISFFFHQTLLLGSFLPSRLFSTRSMCVCVHTIFFMFILRLYRQSLWVMGGIVYNCPDRSWWPLPSCAFFVIWLDLRKAKVYMYFSNVYRELAMTNQLI